MIEETDTHDVDHGLAPLVEELGGAACLTAVVVTDQDAVIRCFGGDPETPGPYRSVADLIELAYDKADTDDGRQLIGVAQAGPAVVVVEINGFEGSREEVLRPLSRLGRTASAYWGEDALSALNLAADGQVLSSFEMLFPDARDGSEPGAWAPLLHGLDFDAAGGYETAGVTAVARATGARLADLVTGEFRTVEIVPVPEAVLPQGLEDSPLLRELPYADYLADLGTHRLAEMRRHAFDLALQHAELVGDPVVDAAMAEFERPSADRAARDRVRADVVARLAATERDAGRELAATEQAQAEAEAAQLCPTTAGPSGLGVVAGRQARLWRLLDYLLADPDLAPSAVLHLQTVMTGTGGLVDRYWLLNRLYWVAELDGR